MPFVVDASILGSWAFPDEDHPLAQVALERVRTDEAFAPLLLWFEIRNILVVNERRRRITRLDTEAFLKTLLTLGIRMDLIPDEGSVLDLARRHKLSVYDASYLALAKQERMLLASLDADLVKAARREAVGLVG